MPQYFTKQGLEKLKEELHQLKTVENKKIVRLIAEAAAFGDLKENSAYHDARDKMSFLRMRIKELEGAINEAIVKEKNEANILKNKISYHSPLGQMLMGKEAGKEFDFMAGAKKVKVKILEIK